MRFHPTEGHVLASCVVGNLQRSSIAGNALQPKRIIARMSSEMAAGVGRSAVEFDESSQANAVESRLSILRTLVEDVVRSSETDVTKEITVDGKLWRIHVSQIA